MHILQPKQSQSLPIGLTQSSDFSQGKTVLMFYLNIAYDYAKNRKYLYIVILLSNGITHVN